jgi:hypothetical protein
MSAGNTTRANADRSAPTKTTPSYNGKASRETAKFEPATPSKVFRVENMPILYFQQLTKISTYTHVSGRPTSISPKVQHQKSSQPPPRLANKNPGPATEDVHNSCDS